MPVSRTLSCVSMQFSTWLLVVVTDLLINYYRTAKESFHTYSSWCLTRVPKLAASPSALQCLRMGRFFHSHLGFQISESGIQNLSLLSLRPDLWIRHLKSLSALSSAPTQASQLQLREAGTPILPKNCVIYSLLSSFFLGSLSISHLCLISPPQIIVQPDVEKTTAKYVIIAMRGANSRAIKLTSQPPSWVAFIVFCCSVIPLMLPIHLVLGYKSNLPTPMFSWGRRDPAMAHSWQINCLTKIQGFPHKFFCLFVSLLWNRWLQLDSPQMPSLEYVRQLGIIYLRYQGNIRGIQGWESKQCVVAL